jgi:rSAM/selenodomain-associated transferase 1
MGESLTLLTKFPQAGKVKTRLAKLIGEEKAAKWQKRILHHLLENIEEFEKQTGDLLKVYLKPIEKRDKFCKIFNLDQDKIYQQPEGNIGKTMNLVFKKELENNNKVALIGSDTPTINKKTLSKTFTKLNSSNNIVLGPSTDGGYYLIAMKNYYPEIFQNVRWSNPQTLKDTLRQAEKQNISYHLLDEFTDIDTIEDLEKVKQL